MNKQKTDTPIIIFKIILLFGLTIFHTVLTIGLLEDMPILGILSGFLPTILALILKPTDMASIILWNFLFMPIADIKIILEIMGVKATTNNIKENQTHYICEACNAVFIKPEKPNKILRALGLMAIYLGLMFIVESIPTTDISLLLPRFIIDCALAVVGIVHIIFTLVKDNGRGKCPKCGSGDFILSTSIKGQDLLKRINKNKKILQ